MKRSYLSSPTMSVDLDIPPTNMNYVLIFAQLYLLLYETQKEKTQQKKLCVCLGVSNKGGRRDRTGSVFQKQGKCCDHVETKFTGNQTDLTYQNSI